MNFKASFIFKRFCKFFLSLSLIFLLSACWDYQGLDKITVVAGVAVDKGEEKKFLVTVEGIVAETSDKGSSFKSSLMEAEGNTITEGLNSISSKLPTKLYYGDMQVLVVSRDVINEGEFELVLESFFRDSERRETVNVVVSGNDKASELLTVDSKKGQIASYELEKNNSKNSKYLGDTFTLKTYEIYNELSEKASDLAIPIYCMISETEETKPEMDEGSAKSEEEAIDFNRKQNKEKGGDEKQGGAGKGGEKKKEGGAPGDEGGDASEKSATENILKSYGCVIFNGKEAASTLSKRDITFLNLASNWERCTNLTFELSKDSGKFVTVRVLRSKADTKFELQGDKLKINMKIDCDVKISEIDEPIDFMDVNLKNGFKEKLCKTISFEVHSLIKKCQAVASEPFGFATQLYRRNNKEWVDIKDNWKQIYKKAEVNVECAANVCNTGFIISYD